jgi:hypothetical protein
MRYTSPISPLPLLVKVKAAHCPQSSSLTTTETANMKLLAVTLVSSIQLEYGEKPRDCEIKYYSVRCRWKRQVPVKRWYLAPALHDVTSLKITLLTITFRAERIGSLGTENWTVRKKDSARLANDLMTFLEPFVGAS